MPAEKRVSLLVLIIVVGFFAGVAYHYALGTYFERGWPANTFLFKPWDRFGDFTKVVDQSSGLDPFGAGGDGFAGSPFGQMVGYLFSVIRPASLRLPLFLGSFFVALILMVKHGLYGLKSRLASGQWLALFAIVFLTYPVLFAADRANFDLMVLPCLFLFALAYSRQRYKSSTIFLGMAMALKPYAAVFIMVYIFDRRYRDTLIVFFNAALLSTVSLALFKGGLLDEARKYFELLWHMGNDPSFGSDLAYTSDLFSLLTVVTRSVADALGLGPVDLLEHSNVKLGYGILAAALAVYLAVHLWQNPQPRWKTMTVLTTLIILLPFSSHDYRLIYLFVPMLMYLSADETARRDPVIVTIWGLLLVPKDYYHLGPIQSISMIINPVLLIGLLRYVVPEAFSARGIRSSLRLAVSRLRFTGQSGKLENPRSS